MASHFVCVCDWAAPCSPDVAQVQGGWREAATESSLYEYIHRSFSQPPSQRLSKPARELHSPTRIQKWQSKRRKPELPSTFWPGSAEVIRLITHAQQIIACCHSNCCPFGLGWDTRTIRRPIAQRSRVFTCVRSSHRMSCLESC